MAGYIFVMNMTESDIIMFVQFKHLGTLQMKVIYIYIIYIYIYIYICVCVCVCDYVEMTHDRVCLNLGEHSSAY